MDEDLSTSGFIKNQIESLKHNWEILMYTTPFALVTGVYDELKGDLDLAMVRLTGIDDERIDMMKDLQDYFPHIRAVFYSDNTECAESIFKAVPTFFLKLPLNEEKLTNAIERVEKYFCEDVNQTFVIKLGGKIQKLRFSALRYIESLGRKLVFYTDNGAYEANMNMDSIMEKLPECFFRVHRSYIANMNYASALLDGNLVMFNGEEIPVSRTNLQRVKEKLCR